VTGHQTRVRLSKGSYIVRFFCCFGVSVELVLVKLYVLNAAKQSYGDTMRDRLGHLQMPSTCVGRGSSARNGVGKGEGATQIT
jgi:hypothetical protein